MSGELKTLVEEAARERGVEKETLVTLLETGIALAAMKKTGRENLSARFDDEKGGFTLFLVKRVQEVIEEPDTEITVDEARLRFPEAQSGDEVTEPFHYGDLDRLAAMMVRRAMNKSLGEINLEAAYNAMYLNRWKVTAAQARGRNDFDDILCNVGEKNGVLPRREQLYREEIKSGDIVQTVITGARKMGKEVFYTLSRTHPLLLGGLLRREVPEISDGHVVVKGVARDTTGRSKVAVAAKRDDVDAVGACIGPAGRRIQMISEALAGEKIDIIEWSEKPEEYVARALTPAKISSVVCDNRTGRAEVTAEEGQRALAVGKKGLNIKLASRLTRWEISLK